MLFIYLNFLWHTGVTAVIWNFREIALNASSLSGVSQMNFPTSTSPKQTNFMNMVGFFFWGGVVLEVFIAVIIMIRLGTYMAFSPFKVLFSKKNLKVHFKSHLLFTVVGTTVFTNTRESLCLFENMDLFCYQKPPGYNQHFYLQKLCISPFCLICSSITKIATNYINESLLT